MKRAPTSSPGFTIVELIVAITIIGLLAGLALTAPSSMRVSARDQERAEDIANLVRRLEQAYTGQEIGGPAYPSTTEFTSDIASTTRTGLRIDKESLKAPNTVGASSVVGATSASTTAPLGGAVTFNDYVYQPLTSSNGLCTAANSVSSAATTCVRFNFYYRTEADNTMRQVKSFHQQ